MKFLRKVGDPIEIQEPEYVSSDLIRQNLGEYKHCFDIEDDGKFDFFIEEIKVFGKLTVENFNSTLVSRFYFKCSYKEIEICQNYFCGYGKNIKLSLYMGIKSILSEIKSDSFQALLSEIKIKIEAGDLNKLVGKANNNKKKVNKI